MSGACGKCSATKKIDDDFIYADMYKSVSATRQTSSSGTKTNSLSMPEKQSTLDIDLVNSMIVILEKWIECWRWSADHSLMRFSSPLESHWVKQRTRTYHPMISLLPTPFRFTEPTSSKQPTKSGYDVASQVDIVKAVKWLHGFWGQIHNYSNTKPDSFDIQAFFYAYL